MLLASLGLSPLVAQEPFSLYLRRGESVRYIGEINPQSDVVKFRFRRKLRKFTFDLARARHRQIEFARQFLSRNELAGAGLRIAEHHYSPVDFLGTAIVVGPGRKVDVQPTIAREWFAHHDFNQFDNPRILRAPERHNSNFRPVRFEGPVPAEKLIALPVDWFEHIILEMPYRGGVTTVHLLDSFFDPILKMRTIRLVRTPTWDAFAAGENPPFTHHWQVGCVPQGELFYVNDADEYAFARSGSDSHTEQRMTIGNHYRYLKRNRLEKYGMNFDTFAPQLNAFPTSWIDPTGNPVRRNLRVAALALADEPSRQIFFSRMGSLRGPFRTTPVQGECAARLARESFLPFPRPRH